ncbi:MAG: shikimate dehydrogenase [Acidimicrobiales bacterium]|nr:shikimate dehydrogenase [Acidimicrobiales bacterium]MDP7258148.1 shikimate dehydrogenase [Acidimicrobiales bacterium]HJO79868.1 shikimate dehydrogenase [Acidimicrobiales bacterium]
MAENRGPITQLAAVIGSPVAHSLSPAIMNAAFAAADLDWTFIAHEVAEGNAVKALDWARRDGLIGLSVTMPHKGAVAAAVDELSDVADRLVAVNCVVIEGDHLIGHNTDGGGFIDGLAHDSGLDPAGRRAVVVGAGGAARAVVHALGTAGAVDIAVINRTPARAEAAAALAGEVGRVATAEAVEGADLVVNATPVGMGPDDQAVPVDPDLMNPGQVAVDLIYHPLATPWVATLRERGIEAHGGLSMLIFQAARAFTHWTGREAPVAAMEQAARAELAARAAD